MARDLGDQHQMMGNSDIYLRGRGKEALRTSWLPSKNMEGDEPDRDDGLRRGEECRYDQKHQRHTSGFPNESHCSREASLRTYVVVVELTAAAAASSRQAWKVVVDPAPIPDTCAD